MAHPPKKHMAKVPPYKLICKYVENVNIILEYRGASGPQEKKKKKSWPMKNTDRDR